MSTSRETLFHCSYQSDGRRETTVVPAWDPEMAEALFRDQLVDTTEPGVIEIASPRGDVARRAIWRYERSDATVPA